MWTIFTLLALLVIWRFFKKRLLALFPLSSAGHGELNRIASPARRDPGVGQIVSSLCTSEGRTLRCERFPIGLAVATVLALASLTALVPKALADPGSCSVELLEGTFSYAGQFLASSGSPEIFLSIGGYSPFAWAGTISFDGDGHLTGVDVVNLGSGGISRTYTGTYKVVDPKASPKHCAFTSTFTAVYQAPVPPLTPATFDLYMVLGRDSKFLEVVNTGPGFIQAFKAERKSPSQEEIVSEKSP